MIKKKIYCVASALTGIKIFLMKYQLFIKRMHSKFSQIYSNISKRGDRPAPTKIWTQKTSESTSTFTSILNISLVTSSVNSLSKMSFESGHPWCSYHFLPFSSHFFICASSAAPTSKIELQSANFSASLLASTWSRYHRLYPKTQPPLPHHPTATSLSLSLN